MARLRLENLSKNFGKIVALHSVSLEIPEGQFTAILGPSGCGKSTMLRMIAGLETPSGGKIFVGDEDVTEIPPERRNLGMMFQSYALFPHMNVAQNVRFPLRMQRIGNRQEQEKKVQQVLELVHLEEYAGQMPNKLSGGQQQRVALARAIVSEPRVLLLDEPLSNLDARLREEMQVELIDLHRRLGLTTLFVTHDQDEALSLSDTVVLLNAGEVEQIGSPKEIYSRPQTPFAADFLGSANLLPVKITQDSANQWRAAIEDNPSFPVQAPSSGQMGEYYLMLRQEDLVLSDKPNEWEVAVPVQITTSVYKGALTQYVVTIYGHRLKVLLGKAQYAAAGEATHLCWRKQDALVLE